jgi:hypothetical protein
MTGKKTATIDSMMVLTQMGDTTYFVSRRNPPNLNYYLKVLDRVFEITSSKDTTLVYDYSLNEGDSFYYKKGNTTFYVDSVRDVPLLNGKYYRHWYLHHNMWQKANLIWIKDLGEIFYGWDYFLSTVQTNVGGGIVSICTNNEVVYWSSKLIQEPGFPISPDCNYEQIRRNVSVSLPGLTRMKLYPNPARDYLCISGDPSVTYSIYDGLGTMVLEGIGAAEIDISNLPMGIYFICFENKGVVQREGFVKW